MWINQRGMNLTSQQVCDWLKRLAGASITVEELERTHGPGSVYSNGGIWYQRVS